jgi:hypothetical protein
LKRIYKYICFLIVFMALVPPAWGAVGVEYRGAMETVFRQSTVEELNGKLKLQLFTEVLTEQGPIKGFVLYKLNDEEKHISSYFGGSYLPQVIRVSMGVPLLSKPIFTLGNLSLDLSPYALKIDGVNGSLSARGASIQKLRVGPFETNAFLFWDPTVYFSNVQVGSAKDNICYGGEVRFGTGKIKLSLTGARYEDRYLPSGSNSFSVPNLEEEVLVLEGNQKLGSKFELGATLGRMDRTSRHRDSTGEVTASEQNQAQITSFQVTTHLAPGVELVNIWRDFAPGYRPLYRDKTPLFYQSRFSGGNPLDLYSGKRGLDTIVKLGFKGGMLQILAASWEDSAQSDYQSFRKLVVKGELPLGSGWLNLKYKNLEQVEENLHQVGLLENEQLLKLTWKWYRDLFHMPSVRQLSFLAHGDSQGLLTTRRGFAWSFRITDGNFKGLGANIGFINEDGQEGKLWRKELGLSYTTPGGIYFKCYQMLPQLGSEVVIEDRWDADFEEIIYQHNFWELGAKLAF